MVEFISYKDEKLPISINMGVMLELQKNGLDIGTDDPVKSYEAMKQLFWLSLKHGHFHEEKDLIIKEENLPFYFAYCLSEFQEKMKAFTDSQEKTKKPKKETVKKRLNKQV